MFVCVCVFWEKKIFMWQIKRQQKKKKNAKKLWKSGKRCVFGWDGGGWGGGAVVAAAVVAAAIL